MSVALLSISNIVKDRSLVLLIAFVIRILYALVYVFGTRCI